MRDELGLHLATFGPSLGDARAVGFATLVTVVVGSLVAGAFSGKLLEIARLAFGYGFVAAVAVALVFVLLGPTLQVQVFEHGLRAPGFLPPPVAIRWPEIGTIDEFSNASGAYLRLHPAQGGRRAYLPLAVARQPEFCRLVSAQAGAAHPLASWLQIQGA